MRKRHYQAARQYNLQRLITQVGSQAALAEKLGVTPSFVSQLVNGHRQIGDDVAAKIEAAFDLQTNWLDMQPGQHDDDFDGIETMRVADQALKYGSLTEARQDEDVDLVSVDSYFAWASGGPGASNDSEMSVPGGFYFKRASLDKKGLLGRPISCIFARGQSMEPTISDGDLLLLDHGDEGIKDGEVYAFLWADELRCKRLFKRPDGRLIIRSDNPDRGRFPEEVLQDGETGFMLVGRVVWRGGWI